MQGISATGCRTCGSAFCTESRWSCSLQEPGQAEPFLGRDCSLAPGELIYSVKPNSEKCLGPTAKLVLSLIMLAVTSW